MNFLMTVPNELIGTNLQASRFELQFNETGGSQHSFVEAAANFTDPSEDSGAANLGSLIEDHEVLLQVKIDPEKVGKGQITST